LCEADIDTFRRHPSQRTLAALLGLVALLLSACATLPPGAHQPKAESTALERPEDTALGRKVEPRAKAHPGLSAFRLFASGSDALSLRVQMADSAQRTLDVQYFIFKDDDSGRLLMSALLRAASRGVRVRMLIDDTEARGQDDRVAVLAAHANIDVRLYNPFFYRGSVALVRYAEFALTSSRLNYRMHNKLFIADNEIAVVGGRNIGDEYFDSGDEPQFGDYDVFAMGPVTRQLSKSFDEYWNSTLAVPVRELLGTVPSGPKLQQMEDELAAHRAAGDDAVAERPVHAGRDVGDHVALAQRGDGDDLVEDQ
jgi:putative cardiolipin synthase